MKSRRPPIAVLLAILCTAPATWADLKNPTYTRAKQSYSRGDWVNAQRQLQDYMREDTTFLEKHIDIRKAIEAALDYCNGQADRRVDLAAVSAALDADPAPALP
jgi:hypothetical protein